MKILHIDSNHELLIQKLNNLGFTNETDYSASKAEIESKISQYHGIVIRSRFSIDKSFIDKAKQLKFIARVGAGLESIDTNYAQSKGIQLFSASEGNRNAVAEHALAVLLSLFNNLNKADRQVRQGTWLREANRGVELSGKTIGIIGYGNAGKAFAKILKGFKLTVLCHDILPNVSDANATQVPLTEIQNRADVISLHVPQTALTTGMVNSAFIKKCKKPFWLINTARGKCVITQDLVVALQSGKVLGTGLDVLEYENTSFENLFKNKAEEANQSNTAKILDNAANNTNIPKAFEYLINADNVLLTPHIAGWTHESKIKLAQTIVDKIQANFL